MKYQADKRRKDVQFEVGDWVFLKLRPHRQNSVVQRIHQKLAPRFFGPYQIMKKIGQVAYKLKLPPTSKIHPTFHVSQLKKAEGNYTTTTTTQLPISLESEKGDITPAKVLSWRDKFDGGQHKREWLIQWEGMDVGDATWEEELLLKSQFPDLRLEDKANVVGVSVSVVGLLMGSIYAYWALKKIKLIKLKEQFFQQNGGLLLQQQLVKYGGSTETTKIFTAEELNKATNNFDEENIVGQGGQGTVYKGVLQDNRTLAIKKSKINDSSQVEPFINEVILLSQINHRNVVKLLGCCLETEVPLLVYEFIPNGTLYEHLHDLNQSIKLSWKTRLRIAKETAGVLAYLHSAASTPIIHRDVKSTNILLDDNLTAKVSDFGASRMVPLDKTQITTLVQGTMGYLDPEYFQTSQLTEKSDVYSFGVVLAELLTGKKALCFGRPEVGRNLALYFVSSMKEGQLFHILDKNIDEPNVEHLKEVALITERCLRVKSEERPTMKEVAMGLEGILVIEEQQNWGSDKLPSEVTENKLNAAPSVINVEHGVGGSGINSSDSYSINQISMSGIGGR
ncbi:hypothetical protein KIW84_052550 [Lathyrus oleraceus]|uniref:Protein kinase domain-containing protein n=1 Tax=Pisum sativum TaxID=3888 RepID=A0A9D4WQM3_PEA|nr:hypothetical protein KIW84_052550 [Pisum sativum]